jgi:hypothetical protein
MRWAADYSSNRALIADSAPGMGLLVDVAARLQRQTETSQIAWNASARAQRYSGESYADSDDYAFDLEFQREYERRALDLVVYKRAQSTLLSELESSGLIQADARRSERGANAALAIDLGERLQASLAVASSHVDYSGRNAALFPGYRYTVLEASTSYAVGPRTTLFANTTLGDLGVPGFAYSTIDTGANVGIIRNLTERLQAELAGGYSRTRSAGRSEAGWTARTVIEGRTQRASWLIGYEQAVQPSGLGTLVRRSITRGQYAIDWSPRLRFVLAGRRTRNDSILSSNVGERRQVEDTEVRLEWRLGRAWSAGARWGLARAGGRADALVTTDEIFTGWRTGIIVSWNPDPRQISP